MLSPHIFRSNDIRGVFTIDFSLEDVQNIGRAYGTWLHIQCDSQANLRVVIGRDARTHGLAILEAFSLGMQEVGIDVTDIGMVSSPLLYFACRTGMFDGGVMVTASHNPPEYNGFKLLGEDAATCMKADIESIQTIVEESTWKLSQVEGNYEEASYMESYADVITSITHHNVLDKKTVVVDAGNSVMGAIAPKILRSLGYNVIELFCEVDGNAPNHPANPEELETLIWLQKSVQESGALLGIAFDGDGDRLGIVSSDGSVISSDHIALLLLKDIALRVENPVVVYNVSLSSLIPREVEKIGGKAYECRVGHAFIKEMMREKNAHFAAESSGHFFFSEQYFGFDDALLASLRVLSYLSVQKSSLIDELQLLPPVFVSPEVKISVSEESKSSLMQRVVEYCESRGYLLNYTDGVKILFDDGWLLIRSSNTSPEVKFRAEASTQEELEHHIRFARTLLHHITGFGL